MVPVWIALLFLSIVSHFLAIDIPRQKVQYEMLRAEHDATSFLAYRKGIIDYLKANPTDSINLMLEVRLANGWQRAQYHFHNWFSCGYSHGTCFLPPHSYVPLPGYEPTTGRAAMTRFAIHNGAHDIPVSDEFEGGYSPDDVAMRSYDIMSFRAASLDKLRAFLLREAVP